ncbi:MAG TPA: MerC domain-containing protein [Candidatus Saccharimonadia bacterium]|nr:MerC domain-containing protein [Candidatus Saccharimonadia bacterium]
MIPATRLATTDAEAQGVLPQLDLVGAGASFLCAVHCAVMPVLLSTLPLAGIEVLADHRVEQVFVVSAALFGPLVIGSGYCRHRIAAVAFAYLAGVASLFAGAYFAHGAAAHAVLLAGGGVMLGIAHAMNRRGVLRHRCARNAFARS